MSTATLRSVGGSVVMAIPKQLLERVHLHVGSQVNIDVLDSKLIIEAKNSKPHYTLRKLMAQRDLSHPISKQEAEWLETPSVGNEDV
jgi:antitoxin ChpS